MTSPLHASTQLSRFCQMRSTSICHLLPAATQEVTKCVTNMQIWQISHFLYTKRSVFQLRASFFDKPCNVKLLIGICHFFASARFLCEYATMMTRKDASIRGQGGIHKWHHNFWKKNFHFFLYDQMDELLWFNRKKSPENNVISVKVCIESKQDMNANVQESVLKSFDREKKWLVICSLPTFMNDFSNLIYWFLFLTHGL